MSDTSGDGPQKGYNLQHIRIEAFRASSAYSPPRRDMSGRSSGKNPKTHGRHLQQQLDEALDVARRTATDRDTSVSVGDLGHYLVIESADRLPDVTWSEPGIRLGAIQATEEGQKGVLFVPDRSEEFLKTKVREYAEEETSKGNPKNQAKIEPIDRIHPATLASLWTDQRPLPDKGKPIWWECWCWDDVAENLITVASTLKLRISENRLYFPEFEVIPIYGTLEQLQSIIQNTDAVAELRKATDNPTFFMTDAEREQDAFVDDLVRRVLPPPNDAPAICILDTGIARAHPLILPALDQQDCLAVKRAWGVDDHDDHGTNMAGNALYGDLTYPLADQRTVQHQSRLESVKILAPPGTAANDPNHYGSITQSAIAIPEINRPDRQRTFCMAVTNEDVSGERPTSWSAAVDQACAGVMPGDDDQSGEKKRRLFIVSAGNIRNVEALDGFHDPNEFPVEDPAQAWNALTIGGFTDKVEITDPTLKGWQPAARPGDRSPYSRISTDWPHNAAPIKPEVVFEAGNRAINASKTEMSAGVDSLSLLTTNRDFITQPLTTFWATSAATAQAGGFAGAVMAAHPDLWPETIRALMVHSARWTPRMRNQFRRIANKTDRFPLVRQFGYGVPQLDRPLASAAGDVALFSQIDIQPFQRVRRVDEKGKVSYSIIFRDSHFYDLPWPRQTLEELDANVQLKVTLSYFIEPSPGEAAPTNPYRYQSFGLRFRLKRADETDGDFVKRVNRLEREEGDALSPTEPDDNWFLGPKAVSAGSLHCDVWEGPAVQLAERDRIAVYPVGGWWKKQARHKRYDDRTRYALIITITAPEVDLYTEIMNEVAVRTGVTIGT